MDLPFIIEYRLRKRIAYIKDRCNNKKNKDYPIYGGRGIKCELSKKELKEIYIKDCEEAGFDPFDLEEGLMFLSSHHIDRIDGRHSYKMGNVQFLNKKDNIIKQSCKVNHFVLSDDLVAPLFLLDWFFHKRKKSLVRRVKYKKYNLLSKPMQDRIPLFFYDLKKPPLDMVDGEFLCLCGEWHKPCYRKEHECEVIRKAMRIGLSDTIKKPVCLDEVKSAEQYLKEFSFGA